MYDTFKWQGKQLTEWQPLMRYEYTLGELYRMAMEGHDFDMLVRQIHG